MAGEELAENSPCRHPVAAVGVVVCKDGQVLLVRRDQPPSKGLWAVPGGSIRLGETIADAAVREVYEETGIMVCVLRPVHAFESIMRDDGGAVSHHYVVVDVTAEYLSGAPKAGDDAADARWVALVDLPSLDVSAETLKLVQRLCTRGP